MLPGVFTLVRGVSSYTSFLLSDKYIVDGGEVSELTAETHSKARWSNSAVPSQAICKPIGCSG